MAWYVKVGLDNVEHGPFGTLCEAEEWLDMNEFYAGESLMCSVHEVPDTPVRELDWLAWDEDGTVRTQTHEEYLEELAKYELNQHMERECDEH